MADSEFERLISRYRQELMRFAEKGQDPVRQEKMNTDIRPQTGNNESPFVQGTETRSPSSGNENGKGELREFDDGFLSLEDLRDRAVGGATDSDQTDPLNAQALDRAENDFDDGKKVFGVIMGNAFGEATDEDTPQPIIIDRRNDSVGNNTPQFTGVLEVTARTGSEALPVEGALVTVTSGDESGRRLEQVAMTDASGKARLFDLPAANPENSQNPDMSNRYFLYNAAISKAGFYDMESKNIPLFGGITSRQDFSMVPLPEGMPQEIIVNENTEPDNLRRTE